MAPRLVSLLLEQQVTWKMNGISSDFFYPALPQADKHPQRMWGLMVLMSCLRAGLVPGSAPQLLSTAMGAQGEASCRKVSSIPYHTPQTLQAGCGPPKHCLFGQHSYPTWTLVSLSRDTATAESGLLPLPPHIRLEASISGHQSQNPHFLLQAGAGFP